MLFDGCFTANILSFYNIRRQKRKLLLKPRRKHRKPHDFNKADILFLDMMQLLVGMINAQRMFFCGNIISENQIQLIGIAAFSGDGSNGIMRFSISFSKDKGGFIRIASPRL